MWENATVEPQDMHAQAHEIAYIAMSQDRDALQDALARLPRTQLDGVALGCVLRFAGPDMLKLLLDAGALHLAHREEWEELGTQRAQAWVPSASLQYLFEAFRPEIDSDFESACMCSAERVECVQTLLVSQVADPQILLYLALLYADSDVFAYLEGRGAAFSEANRVFLRGDVTTRPLSRKEVWCTSHLRDVLEHATDEQLAGVVRRFTDCFGGTFPAVQYRILKPQRLYASAFFPLFAEKTDIMRHVQKWDVARALLEANNAAGLAYAVDAQWLSKAAEQEYLLELAHRQKASPDVLAVLLPACSYSALGTLELEDGSTPEDLSRSWGFSLQIGGTYIITGYEGSETDVYVPASIDGIPVTSLAQGTFDASALGIGEAVQVRRKAVQSVTIPGTVRTIPPKLFAHSQSTERDLFLDCIMPPVKKVTLCEGTREIGPQAFWDCRDLEKIVFPSTLEAIGRDAFLNCNALQMDLEESLRGVRGVGDGAFRDSGVAGLTVPGNAKEIRAWAFQTCRNLAHVTLENGVELVGWEAFGTCTGLRKIVLPASIREIRSGAFRGCEALEKVVLNPGLQTIGSGAFRFCRALKEIEIPGSVKQIPDHAFDGCSSLKRVVLKHGVRRIGNGAFNGCTSLREIILPRSVWRIAPNAFNGTQVEVSRKLKGLFSGAER